VKGIHFHVQQLQEKALKVVRGNQSNGVREKRSRSFLLTFFSRRFALTTRWRIRQMRRLSDSPIWNNSLAEFNLRAVLPAMSRPMRIKRQRLEN